MCMNTGWSNNFKDSSHSNVHASTINMLTNNCHIKGKVSFNLTEKYTEGAV